MYQSPSHAPSITGASDSNTERAHAASSARPVCSASSATTRKPFAIRKVENIDSPVVPNWMQSFQSAWRPCTSPLLPRWSRENWIAWRRCSKTVADP